MMRAITFEAQINVLLTLGENGRSSAETRSKAGIRDEVLDLLIAIETR